MSILQIWTKMATECEDLDEERSQTGSQEGFYDELLNGKIYYPRKYPSTGNTYNNFKINNNNFDILFFRCV